ncbi:glycosyltransferase family 25 protein [Litorisediminicola beolgyonensis]
MMGLENFGAINFNHASEIHRHTLDRQHGPEFLKNQKNNPLPIIFINLDNDVERREVMERGFQRQGIKYERFSAVPGSSLSQKDLERICPNRRLWWRSAPLSLGEIGCFLSHKKTLQRISEGPHPVVCVLEDDVILNEELFEVIETVQVPPRIGIIKLEGSTGAVPRLSVRVASVGRWSIEVFGLPKWRSAGYIVTRLAAKTLVSKLDNIYGPVDQVLFEPWKTGVIVAEIRPFPTKQVGRDSSIDRELDGGRRLDARQFILLLIRWFIGHLWMMRHFSRFRKVGGS